MAFRDYSCYDKNEEKLRNSAASWLLKALQASDISNTETFCCIIALGLVCDQRRDNKITVANMEEAENVLTHIERYVYMQDAEIARKCADIALKLIGGEQLNQLEEQFRGVAAIEKMHEERYRKLLSNVEAMQVFEKSGGSACHQGWKDSFGI